MNILLFSPVPLYPILSGRELRYYHLWRAVAKIHKVHLLCMVTETPSDQTKQHLDEIFETVQYVYHKDSPVGGRPRSLGEKLKGLWNVPWDYFHEGEFSPEARDAVYESIDKYRIDGIYAYGWSLRDYFKDIGDLPIVHDIGDDPSVLTRRFIRHRPGLLNKARAVKDWLTARAYEKQYFGRIEEMVLISADDARVFRKLCPRTNVTIIPNGVDSEFFRQQEKIEHDDPVLLFTGVMDYEPNVTAALFFCRSIYPLIKKEMPDVSLYLVGRNPSPIVSELANRDLAITVTGGVDDIRDYFKKAQVYVCPLRSGAGIKNKILESWAMEIPVVATSISCEGIKAAPGKDILVADTPEEFTQKVIDLLTNRNLRHKLTANGRRKVEEDYSWDSRAIMVQEIFNRLLSK